MMDTLPDDYNVVTDIGSPTDDGVLVAWCYSEEGKTSPVRLRVESVLDDNEAYLSPENAEDVAHALLTAAQSARDAANR